MDRFAYWISAIFNPLFIGIPVMLTIGIAETGIRWEATPTVLAAILIMTVVPTAYVIVLWRWHIRPLFCRRVRPARPFVSAA
jgi:hypothetical protein